MFTIKLYRDGKTRIYEAGAVTVLHGNGGHELTLHAVPGRDDFRVDISADPGKPEPLVEYFDSAVIENSNGKTSEIFRTQPAFAQLGSQTDDQFPLKAA